ncbi:PROTEIN SRC2-like protein [Salix koriyanagi]|uniref:PROTEIN SRC2-like protein n=1 Tax=Salix koriyanagi TaxID=2511006 RepID=A0A9Q0W0R3_9ROSI|nr:PROTEIN SRC2-like protein [Salix koriyanagi]
MERRPLDITVASGKGLKDVNLIGKMDVYCVVSIKGDPHKSKQKQKTNVHQDCGPNPVWNYPMKFTIDEAAAQQNRLQIKFKLVAERMMGDKDVGVTPSGKMKGTLNFSYNLGEKFNAPAPEKAKKMDEHVAGANTAKGIS